MHQKIFEKTLALINDKSIQNIKKWKRFALNQWKNAELKNKPKPMINGLYAMWNKTCGCIYIGKGKPIKGRINSHYNAINGIEKAKAWKEFFEHEMIKKEITIYWYCIDDDNDYLAERQRQSLERLLQIKYEPLFERMYKGKYKILGKNKFKVSLEKECPGS
ncbi:MAG TPA: GIY-YIG nuclease family protein [Chitinophagaceae bacterium]|nr:GIY-YIG nuclease family protein [Chitinophagaceae bacterium]